MHYEDNRAGRKAGNHRSDGRGELLHATKYSIQSGLTVPPTVLVTELDNGTLVLQGRPDGPRVWLEPANAESLRRELAAAFRRIELQTHDDQGDAR